MLGWSLASSAARPETRTEGVTMTTRTPRILLASAALLPIAAVTLAACGGGSSKAGASATTVVTTVNGQPATIDVANSGLGKILVDSQGRTVYLFGKDSGTTSECTGACASNWPPVTVNGTPTAGSGAIASMVGTTTRSDGTSQV